MSMVMIFPAIWWGWSPPMEWVPFTEDPLGNLGILIIPSLILGTAMSAFHPDRSVHHRAQYGDQYPDRRHFRIHWG